MKKYYKYLVFLFIFGFVNLSNSYSIDVSIPGKGGVVVNPDGSYQICPEWAWSKCASMSLGDLIDYIFTPETGGDGLVVSLSQSFPVNTVAVIYDESGTPVDEVSVTINWISDTGQIGINGQAREYSTVD